MSVEFFQKGSGQFQLDFDTRGTTMVVPVKVDNITGADWKAKIANAAAQLPAMGTALDPVNFPGLLLVGAQASNVLQCIQGVANPVAWYNLRYSTVTLGLQVSGASDTQPPIVESGSIAVNEQTNFDALGNVVFVSPPSTVSGERPQPAEWTQTNFTKFLRLRRREATTAFDSYSSNYSSKTNSVTFRARPPGTLLMNSIIGRSSTEGEGYDVVYDMSEDANGKFVTRVVYRGEDGQRHPDVSVANGGYIDITTAHESIDFNLIPGLNA